MEREPGTHGFQVQPRWWVVERSFAWLIRNHRLAKDYERRVQTSEPLIEVAATRLVPRRRAVHLTEGADRAGGSQRGIAKGDRTRATAPASECRMNPLPHRRRLALGIEHRDD